MYVLPKRDVACSDREVLIYFEFEVGGAVRILSFPMLVLSEDGGSAECGEDGNGEGLDELGIGLW